MNVSELHNLINNRMLVPRPKNNKTGGEIVSIEGMVTIFKDYKTGEGKFGRYSFQRGILEQKGNAEESIDIEFAGFDKFQPVTEYVQMESMMTDNGLIGLAVIEDEYTDKEGKYHSKLVLRITPKARILGLERANAGVYPQPEHRAERQTPSQPDHVDLGYSPKDDNINRQCAIKAACEYYANKEADAGAILALAKALYNWTMGTYRRPVASQDGQDALPKPQTDKTPVSESETPDGSIEGLQREIRRICETDDDPRACWAKVMKLHGLNCRPEDVTDKKTLELIINDLNVPF